MIFGAHTFASQFNVSSLNGINGFVINGIDSSKNLGVSIATGDVNGDGKSNLILAEADKYLCVGGNAYVVLGQGDFSHNNPFDLQSLNGTNGYKITNLQGCPSQGFTVSSGDLDGNGRADILIGSGAQQSGAEVYVVFS